MSAAISVDEIRGFRCFQNLGEADIEALARNLDEVTLAPGQILFREGDPGESAYLIISGQVEVTIKIPDQAPRTLAVLDAGSVLGEISLLTHEARTASVTAVTATRLWDISRTELQTAVDAGEVWATQFLLATALALAHRLSTLDHQLVELIGAQPKPDEAKTAELEQLRRRLFTEWTF